MSDTPTTPAGWYDDGSGRRRYWDGAAWTDHYETPAAAVPPVATPYGASSAAPSLVATQVSTPSGPATPPGGRRPGVLGLVALGVAVIGFIFACVPGALIVGWVLLPVAFVLSIVAFFLRGAKWPAITALILSIVGVVVAVLVFLFVVATAFHNAFSDVPTIGSGSTVGPPVTSSSAPATSAAAGTGTAGSRTNPAAIGATITAKDFTVVVNSVTLDAGDQVSAANSFNDPAPDGESYMLVNATVTYTGSTSSYAAEVQFAFVATSGEVYNSYDAIAVPPDPQIGYDELYTGGSTTGNLVIAIPSDGDGVLRVTPGILADDVFVSVR